MPITFRQINAMPDILGTDRFTAFFPVLPGGATSQAMAVHNVDITLPPYEVAQTVVKILGWTLNFAGRRIQANSMSMGFYEDVTGAMHKALLGWQNMASGFVRAGGWRKNDYAVEVGLQVYDTTGQVSLAFTANNVWPMRVTPPPLADGTNPAKIECDMSVDSVDFVGVVDGNTQTIYTEGSTTPLISMPNVRSMQEMPFNLPLPAEVRMSASTSISLMNSFLNMNVAGGNVVNNAFAGLSNALGIRF